MGEKLERFKAERQRLNDLVLSTDNTHIKRFFTLDNAVYAKGTIPVKYKEMMGLVASMVLRCDDFGIRMDGYLGCEAFDPVISLIRALGIIT